MDKKIDNIEKPKIATVLVSNTIRGIIKDINEQGINKEDIISLLRENGQFILIYFK